MSIPKLGEKKLVLELYEFEDKKQLKKTYITYAEIMKYNEKTIEKLMDSIENTLKKE